MNPKLRFSWLEYRDLYLTFSDSVFFPISSWALYTWRMKKPNQMPMVSSSCSGGLGKGGMFPCGSSECCCQSNFLINHEIPEEMRLSSSTDWMFWCLRDLCEQNPLMWLLNSTRSWSLGFSAQQWSRAVLLRKMSCFLAFPRIFQSPGGVGWAGLCPWGLSSLCPLVCSHSGAVVKADDNVEKTEDEEKGECLPGKKKKKEN